MVFIYLIFKSTCKGDNSEYTAASSELQSDFLSLHFDFIENNVAIDWSENNVAIERASNGLDRTWQKRDLLAICFNDYS